MTQYECPDFFNLILIVLIERPYCQLTFIQSYNIME